MRPSELYLTRHRAFELLKQFIQDVLALKTLANNDIELRKELIRIRQSYDIIVNLDKQNLETAESNKQLIRLELNDLELLKQLVLEDVAHKAPLPVSLIDKTNALLAHLQDLQNKEEQLAAA